MSGKRAISKLSLPDVIANDLRERILSGELAEGETIRQEALAEEYDVSRMPIREALQRLEAEGLVQLPTNRGASVTKHSLDEIREIFDLRILIEVDLFHRSIPAMSEADFKRSGEILTKMEESYDANDVAMWGALNYEFHSSLYAAANRNLTNELLQRIELQSDRYVRMHLSVMDQRKSAMIEHRNLLELACNGKIKEGCDLLASHIQRPRDQLIDMVAAKRAQEELQ